MFGKSNIDYLSICVESLHKTSLLSVIITRAIFRLILRIYDVKVPLNPKNAIHALIGIDIILIFSLQFIVYDNNIHLVNRCDCKISCMIHRIQTRNPTNLSLNSSKTNEN